MRIHCRPYDKSVTIGNGNKMQLVSIPALWFTWIAIYPDTQDFLFEAAAADDAPR
jgi:hypothetical protein